MFPLFLACSPHPQDTAGVGLPATRFDEPWRPQLHFSPEQGWLNDPNGLVFHDGLWHLFYQHYPDDVLWGPMHWGHATSEDLVHWEHQPIALEPSEDGDAWSGSAVVDGDDVLALFTRDGSAQVQHLARLEGDLLVDLGPVLDDPDEQHFRDPKVLRHGEVWVMALAVGDHLAFYSSADLSSWTWLSDFTDETVEGIWECPDLLQVEDGRWVLIASVASSGPQGGSGTVYWVGDFDGLRFEAEQPWRYMDHGSDFYAWQSWSGTAERVGIGWMSNWQYAMLLPTEPFRGAMSTPRRLSLDGDTLVQEPVVGEGAPVDELSEASGLVRSVLPVPGTLELLGEGGEQTLVEVEANRIRVDRTQSGESGFSDAFAAVHEAEYAAGDTIELLVVIDRSSVEVFVDGGRLVFTERVFPSAQSLTVRSDGSVMLAALPTIWPVDGDASRVTMRPGGLDAVAPRMRRVDGDGGADGLRRSRRLR